MPAEDDDSVEANTTRIKCFRNKLCHKFSTGIANNEFEEKWRQISSSLEAVEVYAFRQRIERLKNDPIDHDIQSRVEEQVNQWKKLDNKLARYETEQESIKVPSCLPDELPEERMFGRLQEIQQVTEAIQCGSFSIVWITGGPGFGKTTVASKAAHELAKPEYERTVLFCSLRSKTTLHDAATSMTLACSKNQTQPPENPQHWLLNWSKQQASNVTFVLDNADDVLEDLEDSDEFMNLLEEMRILSRKKVTFMITSRKACSTTGLQTKNVRLACLPVEEAKQILLSRVPDLENRKKLSKVEKLVELCGFVPLALCIAGSLLSDDYNEDEFIQSLEEEPSDVLQVGRRSTDQTSVEKSIKSSFEVLDELEKKALILLCVFPGSFNCDAAKYLIAGCTTNNARSISILRELKERSLVEQPRSRRYQVHQLIQKFVQEIASDKYPELLNQGKKLACAHFMSRLADNANLYWGKDTCKQSVDSFNEDRHNFEFFLQVIAEGIANRDPDVLKLTKRTVAANLLQNCMYLEKCVLPEFYGRILKGILNSTDSSSQPVRTVELLCLLGHEHRKIAGDDLNEYGRCMKSAKAIYSKNRREFKKNPISELYYLNSNARFLSEKWNNKQLQHEIRQSLKVCSESDELNDHPETATTFFYAGRFAKRQKKFKEARDKLGEALDLFNKCLGKHLMTAECFKDIADLYLNVDQCQMQIDKSEDPLGEVMVEPLNISHMYYEKALTMMKELGFDDHKEVLLTIKNFAVCQRTKGNLKEATDLLQKAESIAERELQEDHKFHSTVKIQQALLFQEKLKWRQEGKEEITKKAIALMKSGLEMAMQRGEAIIQEKNKDEIVQFINLYPESFSEEDFPRE